MSWSKPLKFRRIRRNPAVVFREPDIHRYQQAKNIQIVRRDHLKGPGNFCEINQQVLLQAKSALPAHITRVWNELYSRRITLALEKDFNSFELVSLFPGNTWSSFAPLKSIYNESPLLYHHFQSLHSYLNPGLGTSPSNFQVLERKCELNQDWVWSNITLPEIRFVEAIYPSEPAAQDGERLSQDELLKACQKLISPSMLNITALLSLVRKSWCHLNHHPKYSKLSVQLASKIFRSSFRKLDMDNLLPFIFEVEGFASYVSYLERINPVASGVYDSNWLDVGYLPLTSIRATELCVTDRLFGELFNLQEVGFAPVVINEFDCVADGNHRITTAWLWNVLKHASNVPWHIDHDAFKASLKEFAERNESAMGAVSLYECYRQLGIILKDPDKARIMETQLKPVIKSHKAIEHMPVLFAPEYSSNAVIKVCYDNSFELSRVPPRLYEELSQSDNLVLPPRASYHFTDSVAMPWFRVVSEEVPVSIVQNTGVIAS
ncbi:MAG: hypothetical protein GC193_10720 [Cryomorphaceae bacterium]|nr:hypothetical protein [Cryomorphaceae bacterium]